MAYTLSERHKHIQQPPEQPPQQPGLNLGTLASLFFVAGLVSLVTAWIFSFETERVYATKAQPNNSGVFTEAGPITVRKFNEAYHIELEAYIGEMQWSFIEGEVLNASKQSLFSFGEELWHETGYDEGHWREQNNAFNMDITFPNPGTYYIRFSSESSQLPRNVKIKITKRLGSSLPHFWFGITLIIIGILLNEVRNRTISRVVGSLLED